MSSGSDDLPALPRDDDGPVFREPWEAHAFALAVSLHDQGVFTWQEWTAALSAQIQAAQQAGEPDLGERYYEHWTQALERLLVAKHAVRPADLERRTEQ